MSTLEEIKGRHEQAQANGLTGPTVRNETIATLRDLLRAAHRDRCTLIEAVERYADHEHTCGEFELDGKFKCTCGLAEFLSTKSNQPPRAT